LKEKTNHNLSIQVIIHAEINGTAWRIHILAISERAKCYLIMLYKAISSW